MATHNIRINQSHHIVAFTRDDGTDDIVYGVFGETPLDLRAIMAIPEDAPSRIEALSDASDLAHYVTDAIVQDYISSTAAPAPADVTSLYWFNTLLFVPDLGYFEGCDREEAAGIVLRRLNSRDKYGRVIYPSEDVRFLENDLILVVGKKVPYRDVCMPAIKD